MAPFHGPDPEAVIAQLRSASVVDELPLAMGGPGGPTIMIGLLDDQWCVYRTRMDSAAYNAFAKARAAQGLPLMPEHSMRFLVPGTVLLRCDSRQALVKEFQTKTIVLDRSYRGSLVTRTRSSRGSWWRKLLGRAG